MYSLFPITFLPSFLLGDCFPKAGMPAGRQGFLLT